MQRITNILRECQSPGSFNVVVPVVGKNSKQERATHAKSHFMYVPASLLVLFYVTCLLQRLLLHYFYTSFVAIQSVFPSNCSKIMSDVVCTVCYSPPSMQKGSKKAHMLFTSLMYNVKLYLH